MDGDKSQLSAIHDELLDDIDDLSSALRALSVNFEIGDMIKSSSEKIFRSGKELADSMFSYDEFNPDEISKRMVSFETLCVQMWVYCSGLLADMLAGALAGARDSLVYFCAEYALFLIFLSSAALAVAFGIRRSARRTATLARACLSGSPEEARVRYYSAAPFFGREFGEIDALILEAAAARSRLLELSKKLSVACISGRNEIEAASASNSKMLDFADSSLAELEKSLSDSELYGGALKAAGRISGAVSELAASLPKKDDIAGGFARIISEQSEAVRVSEDSIDSALESVGSIGRLAGEIASIADRASLLSLNISIEVGKSGGSGSGLSVLAEQIKTLAKRTGVVVLDMEDVGVNCAESLNAAKSKIAALAAPLSAGPARRRQGYRVRLRHGKFHILPILRRRAHGRVRAVARGGRHFRPHFRSPQGDCEGRKIPYGTFRNFPCFRICPRRTVAGDIFFRIGAALLVFFSENRVENCAGAMASSAELCKNSSEGVSTAAFILRLTRAKSAL